MGLRLLLIKAGGEVISKNLENVVEDVARALSSYDSAILVHGGGDLVDEYCRRMGVEPKFVVSPSGVKSRYTDLEELNVYVMVMAGMVNKSIVASFVKRGIECIGVSGVDSRILTAERKDKILIVEKGRRRLVEGGYTGRIVEVNREAIEYLAKRYRVVVVAPIAVDKSGTMLNVDADQAASSIASALGVERYVVLTDVDGLYVDQRLVKHIRCSEVDGLLSKVGYGMNRKLIEAKRACEGGVSEVIISSGLKERPIENALLKAGTVISRE